MLYNFGVVVTSPLPYIGFCLYYLLYSNQSIKILHSNHTLTLKCVHKTHAVQWFSRHIMYEQRSGMAPPQTVISKFQVKSCRWKTILRAPFKHTLHLTSIRFFIDCSFVVRSLLKRFRLSYGVDFTNTLDRPLKICQSSNLLCFKQFTKLIISCGSPRGRQNHKNSHTLQKHKKKILRKKYCCCGSRYMRLSPHESNS